MNKLHPPDFPGRNLPRLIRRGIPQKIRSGIGIPKNCLYLQTQYHTSPASQPEVRTPGFIQAVTKKAPRRHLS